MKSFMTTKCSFGSVIERERRDSAVTEVIEGFERHWVRTSLPMNPVPGCCQYPRPVKGLDLRLRTACENELHGQENFGLNMNSLNDFKFWLQRWWI